MRQLKITKQVTNRETASLDKYLQEIGRVDLIKTKSSDILLIGDTEHDSEVAEKIGSDCILIDQGYVNRQRLEITKRKIFSNINEAMDHINLNITFS